MKSLPLNFMSRTSLFLCAFALVAGSAEARPNKNIVFLDTKHGRVTIELRPDLAPNHVERIKTLVRQGFYDGVAFQRVAEGFVAQTGQPNGDSNLPDLEAEFSDAPFLRGTLGMVRSHRPNTANAHFFIMLADSRGLDGDYTAFGRVTDGMEVIDKIKKGDSKSDGAVKNPDKIIKMVMESDAN